MSKSIIENGGNIPPVEVAVQSLQKFLDKNFPGKATVLYETAEQARVRQSVELAQAEQVILKARLEEPFLRRLGREADWLQVVGDRNLAGAKKRQFENEEPKRHGGIVVFKLTIPLPSLRIRS